MRIKHHVINGEAFYLDISHKCVVCGQKFGYSSVTDYIQRYNDSGYDIRKTLQGKEIYYIKPFPCPRCKVYQPEMVDLMVNGFYRGERKIGRNEVPWLGYFWGDAIWLVPISLLVTYWFGKYGLWFYALVILASVIGPLIRLLVVNPNRNVNISGVKLPGHENKFTSSRLFAYFMGIVLITLFIFLYNKYTEPIMPEVIYLEILTVVVHFLCLYINHKVLYISRLYPSSIIPNVL